MGTAGKTENEKQIVFWAPAGEFGVLELHAVSGNTACVSVMSVCEIFTQGGCSHFSTLRMPHVQCEHFF